MINPIYDVYSFLDEATQDYYESLSSILKHETACKVANESSTYYVVANEGLKESIAAAWDKFIEFIRSVGRKIADAIIAVWNKIKGLFSKKAGKKKTDPGQAVVLLDSNYLIGIVKGKFNTLSSSLNSLKDDIPEVSFKDIEADKCVKMGSISKGTNMGEANEKLARDVSSAVTAIVTKIAEETKKATEKKKKASSEFDSNFCSFLRKAYIRAMNAFNNFASILLVHIVGAIVSKSGEKGDDINSVKEEIKNIITNEAK